VAIRGRDKYENLSAQGGSREGPPVRFGDHVVPSAVAWETDPIGRSPIVRAEFVMVQGRPSCVSVRIESTPKGRPITTADLESLPGLDRKGLDAFKALAHQIIDDEDWTAGLNLHRRSEIWHSDPRAVSESLKSRPDQELKSVAQIYRENVNGRPVEAVQEHFGFARRTADRRIRAARDRGFLPQTTQGKKQA
jgi:hypothetical protein